MTNDGPTGTEEDIISTLSRANRPAIAYCRQAGSATMPGVVFLTGFRSAMSGEKAKAVAQFCAARDQACLRFDYTGHGVSEGRFEDGTIGDWLGDTLDVIDNLTKGPQVLVGSSMGGWLAVLAALARPSRVAALVLIAPALDLTEDLAWAHMNEAQRERLLADGEVRVPSAYDPQGYVLTRQLIEEGRKHLLLGAPIPFTGPVRILQGMIDPEVPWRHSIRIVDALTSADVTLTLIKGAGHRLSEPDDIRRLLAAVAEVS